ncbi:MAG: DUF4337 family protein [Phreatobacter sp.]
MEELPHEHLEHAEEAHHAVETGDSFLMTVSATIAALAVVAAIIASLETVETSHAIADKNEAVLKQAQASDQWAFFQAKSLKQKILEIAAITTVAQADAFRQEARRHEDESTEIARKAKELEVDRDAKLAAGEVHERRHQRLTYAATLVHVSIAICTIAIIMRGKRWPWYTAIGMGLVGILGAASTYLA